MYISILLEFRILPQVIKWEGLGESRGPFHVWRNVTFQTLKMPQCESQHSWTSPVLVLTVVEHSSTHSRQDGENGHSWKMGVCKCTTSRRHKEGAIERNSIRVSAITSSLYSVYLPLFQILHVSIWMRDANASIIQNFHEILLVWIAAYLRGEEKHARALWLLHWGLSTPSEIKA